MKKRGKQQANEVEVAVSDVVDYLKISGRFTPALRAVVERSLAARAAKKAGLRVTAKELQTGSDVFRMAHDLAKARDMKSWMRAVGVTEESFERYIETNLLVSKFKDRLLKKASPSKCLSSAVITASVREIAYQDWLREALK